MQFLSRLSLCTWKVYCIPLVAFFVRFRVFRTIDCQPVFLTHYYNFVVEQYGARAGTAFGVGPCVLSFCILF